MPSDQLVLGSRRLWRQIVTEPEPVEQESAEEPAVESPAEPESAE